MFKKLFLTLIAIFVIGSVALAQNDTVQLENKTMKCKITGMTATELTVEDRGVEDVIPVNKIKGILFNREPAQFPKVRSLIESGSNEDALELLTEDIILSAPFGPTPSTLRRSIKSERSSAEANP